MSRFEFIGSLPSDESFEHNLLFNLVEEGGLRDFIECEHSSDRQGFKITIEIERTDGKIDSPGQKAQMPWKDCKRLW